MSDWQLRLDLKDVWDKYPDEITIQELSKTIVQRLKKLETNVMTWFTDEVVHGWSDLIYEFEIMSTDKELTEEEFNNTMDTLYDWGDLHLDEKFGGKKVCWIATQF